MWPSPWYPIRGLLLGLNLSSTCQPGSGTVVFPLFQDLAVISTIALLTSSLAIQQIYY